MNNETKTSADRARELLAQMFPAERPLTDLESAKASLRLAVSERNRLPRNSGWLLRLARERVAACRAEVKRLAAASGAQ